MSTITSPGAMRYGIATMRAVIKCYVLRPRRTKRISPRAVTIETSTYDRKRPHVETVKQ